MKSSKIEAGRSVGAPGIRAYTFKLRDGDAVAYIEMCHPVCVLLSWTHGSIRSTNQLNARTPLPIFYV